MIVISFGLSLKFDGRAHSCTIRIFYILARGDFMNHTGTVKQENKAEFIEKRSKFIGYIKPVQTEEEAIAFIQSIKSKALGRYA